MNFNPIKSITSGLASNFCLHSQPQQIQSRGLVKWKKKCNVLKKWEGQTVLYTWCNICGLSVQLKWKPGLLVASCGRPLQCENALTFPHRNGSSVAAVTWQMKYIQFHHPVASATTSFPEVHNPSRWNEPTCACYVHADTSGSIDGEAPIPFITLEKVAAGQICWTMFGELWILTLAYIH